MSLNVCAQLIHKELWITERLFRKKANVTIWKMVENEEERLCTYFRMKRCLMPM